MIPLSPRYARLMFFTILPVLPAVVVHTYIGIQSDDCQNPAKLVDRSGREERMQTFFDAFDWQEGSLETSDPGVVLRYSVVRSYDPKKLYHHPETALFREAGAVARSVEWITVDGEQLPVHRAHYPSQDRTLFVAYMLVYQSRPVADPYWAHLRSFPLQMITGRRPMSLFFVSGTGPRSRRDSIEKRGFEWLMRSWQSYRGACIARG